MECEITPDMMMMMMMMIVMMMSGSNDARTRRIGHEGRCIASSTRSLFIVTKSKEIYTYSINLDP